MFKILKDKKIYIMATGVVLMTTLFAVTTEAGYTNPGSESDPIVSKTYVDKKVTELKNDIANIKPGSTGGSSQASSEVFVVLELKKGDTIIAKESTEIIVRSGEVHAIGSVNGGLSDITEGTDLKTGQIIKPNHLLISARDDGRGISVKSGDTFIMIKGKYSKQ